jgi:hypothetical protein
MAVSQSSGCAILLFTTPDLTEAVVNHLIICPSYKISSCMERVVVLHILQITNIFPVSYKSDGKCELTSLHSTKAVIAFSLPEGDILCCCSLCMV